MKGGRERDRERWRDKSIAFRFLRRELTLRAVPRLFSLQSMIW